MTTRTSLPQLASLALLTAALALAGCHKSASQPPQSSDFGEGPSAKENIQVVGDMSLVHVDKPDQFPLVAAEAYSAAPTVEATGAVFPDVAREVPVISLVSGRVVDIRARLDDHVRKGQLLLKVQSPDSSNAYNQYIKAVNDEILNRKAYVRALDLYKHGAISLAMLEAAEAAEKDALADLNAARELLATLGIDKDHPSPIVNVYSPISGTIVAQNITNAAAAGITYSGSATAFTIADLSQVWVICDVYENDLPKIALGQQARIRLEAYPDHLITGRISDIGPVLDPQLRTAKVRVQVPNPGEILKLGMFATAVLTANHVDQYPSVPAPSVLHLHDRDWVFVPAGGNRFRRVEVKTGDIINGRQLIHSGIDVGQKVVSNVLQLETTLEAQ